MAKTSQDADFVSELTAKLLDSRKYRSMKMPAATIKDLITQAQTITSNPREVEQIVREKLHNLTATYLGDPNYATYSQNWMKPVKKATLPRFGSFAVSCCPATLPRANVCPCSMTSIRVCLPTLAIQPRSWTWLVR